MTLFSLGIKLVLGKLALACTLYMFPGGIIVCSCNGVPPSPPPVITPSKDR
jgi:hypothetical protein